MLTRNKPDVQLLAIVGILTIFGLVALTSASSVVAFEKFKNNFYFIEHQIFFGLFPGLVLFFLCSSIDYRKWRKYALPFLIFSILLLILVLIPGIGTKLGGARSWFVIKGYSFQPSELTKLAFIFYLAAWFEKRGREAKDFIYGFIPFLVILGLIVGLVAFQPDIGTMVIIMIIASLIFFLGGGKFRHLLFLGAGGGLLILFLILAAPYRSARLLTFLNPALDPKGVGYHISQALLAIGSGGLFGVGFGYSRQKFQYLPEVTGDSIFAIIAEEMGFFISAGLILIFLLFLFRAIKIANNAPDQFAKITALGIGGWVTIQAFVNIAAMLGLLPLTGLPLPFISYGGSALAIFLAGTGVLVNISKHTK